jgi:hypothetical protein
MITLDERIRRYLDKCEPAVSGSDGHGTTLKVACALVWGFELSPEEAFRYMLVFNDKCDPPWKPHELRHKIEDAGKIAHQKPRGYLLGQAGNRRREAVQSAPKPVPVRLKPKKSDLRTVRTFISDLRVNVCARTHTLETGMGFRPSEASENASVSKTAQNERATSNQPSEASEAVTSSVEPMPSVEWTPLVAVPGCNIGRPEEIEMADADWRAVVASGLSQEEAVQSALWMFGPGCRVLETGVKA